MAQGPLTLDQTRERSKVTILINTTDYDGSGYIEVLLMNHDHLSIADNFHWEWSGSIENGNATACLSMPKAKDNEDWEEHVEATLQAAIKLLQSWGYQAEDAGL